MLTNIPNQTCLLFSKIFHSEICSSIMRANQNWFIFVILEGIVWLYRYTLSMCIYGWNSTCTELSEFSRARMGCKSALLIASNIIWLPLPESKVHVANTASIWGREDPGWPHISPIDFAIWVILHRSISWINAIATTSYTNHNIQSRSITLSQVCLLLIGWKEMGDIIQCRNTVDKQMRLSGFSRWRSKPAVP